MKDELTTILEAMRAAQAEVADYLVSADRNAELTMALTTSRRSRNPLAVKNRFQTDLSWVVRLNAIRILSNKSLSHARRRRKL